MKIIPNPKQQYKSTVFITNMLQKKTTLDLSIVRKPIQIFIKWWSEDKIETMCMYGEDQSIYYIVM